MLDDETVVCPELITIKTESGLTGSVVLLLLSSVIFFSSVGATSAFGGDVDK